MEAHHRREAVRGDLESARQLNREVLANWDETQIYGSITISGRRPSRTSSPSGSERHVRALWNKKLNNIQFNVAEAVDVEGRGGYYDSSGCPAGHDAKPHVPDALVSVHGGAGSFEPDSIRNEKAKPSCNRCATYTSDEVARFVVRGQYGPAVDDAGNVVEAWYRGEHESPPSRRRDVRRGALHIDNWRWEGVPIYCAPARRCGSAARDHRGVQEAPEVIFRGTPVVHLGPNRLILPHPPYQGIEIQFQAKVPARGSSSSRCTASSRTAMPSSVAIHGLRGHVYACSTATRRCFSAR